MNSYALIVEGDNVSNLYKKYIINLCNHTNFRIFSCTFSKSYQRKVGAVFTKNDFWN